MLKVLVVLCIMGQPCTLFEEDPIKWYMTEDECMKAANNKAQDMMETMTQFGYYIESEAHSCLYVHEQGTI